MINSERLVTFINSLDRGNDEVLDIIENEALEASVPIIRKETQSLLRTLTELKRPKTILEAGTAVGFSAILMAKSGRRDSLVTTIENYEVRIPKAKANIKLAGLEDRISLLEGDAVKIMEELAGPFDMIFLDSAKGQYINMLPCAIRLLSPGGLLISDNVLQDGDVLESRYAVRRRDRTIHARMRDYLYELTHNESLETAILPVGDGITISVKVNEKENI
ncbi:MAG: O-methyltransferase [Lachnospiraceae bacterium]|nr:O-methyltransferase [Lachnospiraceae bacterium]